MKRFLSIFLCVVMLFGLLPVIPGVSAATQDTVIIADDFQDYGEATKVTLDTKGWTEFHQRCHSLITEGGNTYAKLARAISPAGANEDYPRVRKNVAAAAGDIYMIQADVKVSESGLIGFYAKATSSLSLVRFGGNILLNGKSTGYKSAAGKWMTYQLYFKVAQSGDSMDLYLRMWGEGVVDSNGNSVPASAPVVVSKTITSNLDLESNDTTWLYHQGAFASGTAEDYAALDNITLKKIGEELADLSTLTVNGKEIPGFSPDKTTYDLELDYGTTQAVIAATAGTGKTVTVDCPTVTDFPRGVNITVTNNDLGISKTYALNLTVRSTADFDLLLSDDFEGYGTAEKVTNSIKGWNQMTANGHSLVTDGTSRVLKFAIAGTDKYPRARKNITAQVGDTIQAQADLKLSENGYIGFYLRNNSKQEAVYLLKNTDILLNGSATGYQIDPDKWFTCNTHVKLAANGGLMEIYMCLWGEGVVHRNGTVATKENPATISRTINTTLNVESVSTVTIDFMCNFSKGDETDYALVDNVMITKLHSDVAGLTGLTVNDMEVEAVEGTNDEFSIMLPYGTERAVVLAEAGYGRTVTVSESVVTTFPTDVTVAVDNASAGVTKTYTVSVDAMRTATQKEGTLMPAYGGASGIFTMTYDDNYYGTAAYLDQIGAKYNVYSSAMLVTSWLKDPAEREKWQQLFDRGYVEPQNHSMTHMVFPNENWSSANSSYEKNNTPENYQSEIVDSKNLLEEYFGQDMIFYAAPNNALSIGAFEVVMNTHYAARLGYRGVNPLDPNVGTNPGEWYNLKCIWFTAELEEILHHIDIAAEQGGWFLGGCHALGDFDGEGEISVEDAETIFAYVAAYQEENKLWATTNSNATKYIWERQNSRCYVDWVGGNVVVEVVSNGVLDGEIFNHALTVKAQVPAGWNQAKYTCDGVELIADVFEEDGKYWAYVNVVPGETVQVSEQLPLAEELKFEEAAVTLYSDLAVTFKVKPSALEGYTEPKVEFVFDGVKTVVTTYEEVGGLYAFTFENIAPNQMGDTIYATLQATKDGKTYAGNTLEYGISTYCYRMLSRSDVVNNPIYAGYRTLLVDMLNYGAAAQVYTGYKTDALVNEALTETQKAWGTPTTPALSSKTAITNRIENPAAGWKTAILVLDDAVTIRLIFSAADISGMSMKITTDANTTGWVITEESFIYDEENNYYYVDFGGLHAGQMRECIYATVFSGDAAVSHTLRYSIESYAASFAANTDYPAVAELVKAMMRYGDAAYNFAN